MVPKFLPLNGPSGTYSQAWISRADQSFIKTNPNTLASACLLMEMGEPISLPLQMKHPSSSSMSRRLLAENVGTFGSAEGSRRIWPDGRVIGVPEITTEEARP